MKKHTSFLVAGFIIAAIILSACSGSGTNTTSMPPIPERTAGYTNISPVELNSMLAMKDFPLVNVHIPYEGEIAQTDLFIPYDKILDNLAVLPQDKNAKIVIYCRSGSMSATAAGALAEAGYTKVYNLAGGMYAWEKQGYQVLKKEQ